VEHIAFLLRFAQNGKLRVLSLSYRDCAACKKAGATDFCCAVAFPRFVF
jgi:hypothetical protein